MQTSWSSKKKTNLVLALLDLATGNESGVTGVVVKFLGCNEKKKLVKPANQRRETHINIQFMEAVAALEIPKATTPAEKEAS